MKQQSHRITTLLTVLYSSSTLVGGYSQKRNDAWVRRLDVEGAAVGFGVRVNNVDLLALRLHHCARH